MLKSLSKLVVKINEINCYSFSTKINKLLMNMPRDLKHVKEAQKQRMKIKGKSTKYVPGTVNIQILGSGAPGSPASVYLFTDQQRYLFNCGEGTQRLAHEHKAKLARLEHIFMTRNCWERTGGLPGLCLTVQDAGVPNLALHGPPGLGEIFKAMRRFVVLKDLKVNAPSCSGSEVFDDTVMTVYYVPLKKSAQIETTVEENSSSSDLNSRFSPPLEDSTDYYAHEGEKSSDLSNTSPYFNLDLAPTEENTVMTYICKLKPRPGPLNLEKCVDKGVPPGPLLGQLKNGIDIILPNGTVVLANDVRAKEDPGPAFIVLDIPSEDYFDSLQQNEDKFSKYINGNEDENVSLVLHFSPKHIMDTAFYKNFINKFPATTTHLVVNETNKFSGYIAAHRIQVQLNQLNEFVFPLLKESQVEDIILENEETERKRAKLESGNDSKLSNNVVNGNENKNIINYVTSMTCFHLRPHHKLDRSVEQKLHLDEYIQETMVIPNFPDSLGILKNEINKIYENVDRSLEFPKVIFLGTGSCIPNKTRNVSSILIHTNSESCILFDCGEGTVGQIIRMYGEVGAREVFRKLKMIYVSHLHADHHIGLIGLLQMRRKILGDEKSKILLLAPIQMSYWLYFYDRCIESLKYNYELIGNGDLLEKPMTGNIVNKLGLNSIETCLVKHCPHSFGISIELNQTNQEKPVKIIYSGDTMPCHDLVELGKNATILIHEATMENDLIQEAKIKMHSTLNQAIEQGRKMNAKYIILTHFSQRYAKLPRIENDLEKNIGIAFDNMEIILSDLPHLHLLYPTFKLLFSDHCEEMEQKAIKRAFKKQREQIAAENLKC